MELGTFCRKEEVQTMYFCCILQLGDLGTVVELLEVLQPKPIQIGCIISTPKAWIALGPDSPA